MSIAQLFVPTPGFVVGALPGPSRRITVEPIEAPVDPAPGPELPVPEPERRPEPEPVPAS